MLPAQRFQFLDKETNLGMIDPLKINTNDILNTITNQVNEVTGGLSEFITSMKQAAGAPVGMLTNLLNQGVRLTRDAFSAMSNITSFSPKQIESAIADMLPNDRAVQNAFRNVTAQCRNKGLGTNSGFKPYNDSFGCGKGQGVCNSSQVKGLLDKLTGGAASGIARSLNSMLKQILALGRMGYDAGMCKIFGELIKGMPSNIVQRGAAGLLGLVGSAGNTSGVLDIAANMGNAIPSLEIPGLVGIAMSNFTTPVRTTANMLPDLQDGYFTAMDAIQPGWNVASDGILSMANIGNKKSSDMLNMLETTCAKDTFSLSDIGKVVDNPLDSFTGAYKSTATIAKSVTSGIGSFFS